MNLDIARVPVPTIAHVNKDMVRGTGDGDPFNLGKGFRQGVTVIGIAVDGPGTEKPAAPAGRCDTDLATELVSLVCFPLADAFHFRLVNTVDFVCVLSLLGKDPFRRLQ